MMKKVLFGLWMVAGFLMPQAHAGDETDYVKVITGKLAPLNISPDSIKPSVVSGLYEVIDGGRVFYTTKDGSYLISGSIYEVATVSNITDSALNGTRKKFVDAVDESTMVVFSPKGEVKHSVTIFTDIDCGYCRKLHNEMHAYTDLGIKVRYMAYPRAGIGSGSYDKAVNVWCADDRQAAMTTAKAGGRVESKKCDNAVASHFAVSQELGLSGTPSIILESGALVPGYVPAAELVQRLEQ